jgi:hypothetical protein
MEVLKKEGTLPLKNERNPSYLIDVDIHFEIGIFSTVLWILILIVSKGYPTTTPNAPPLKNN